MLTLLRQGLFDERTGIYGWESSYGALGATSVGEGDFLLVEPTQSSEGQGALLHRYEWTGEVPTPFR